MRILALDCATVTGWSACTAPGYVESGVESFAPKRGDSPGTRYLRFRRWLETRVADLRPEILVYETGFQKSRWAGEVYHGLTTRVQEVAAASVPEIECMGVDAQKLKLWATGHGNASKPAMVEEAARRFPHFRLLATRSEDEADSLLLLAYALAGFPETVRAKRPARARAKGTAKARQGTLTEL